MQFYLNHIVYLQPKEDNVESVCPGDNLTYTCTYRNFGISPNDIDEVQLGLTVTYPEQQPVSIVYDNSSPLRVSKDLGLNTVSTLNRWSQSDTIFSVTLTVPPSLIEGTVMECSLLHPIYEGENRIRRIWPDAITIDIPATEGMLCVYIILSH